MKEEDLDTNQNNPMSSSFSAEMTEKNQKITPINTNIETEQRIHLNLIDEKLIKEREKLLEEMRKPIFFNCYEIILRPCCRYSKLHLKNLLYQKALKKINYSLDVINYIKKMQEIDILKYLLLDKDQIKLFNFLTLPSISLKSSDSDEHFKNLLKAPLYNAKFQSEELNAVIESYSAIKNKNDDLNNRLFYLFDSEVDHLLIDC